MYYIFLKNQRFVRVAEKTFRKYAGKYIKTIKTFSYK